MATYDAFVSYSHSKDKPIAAALQSVVQKLGKPWYRRRALRVFRDDTSLSATPYLWPTIEQALGQSRFLVLLASPEAAASQWVNKEVAWWLDHKGVDTLLIAATDGELIWDNSLGDFTWREAMPLPPALRGRFPSEPKWVDLRAYRDQANINDAKFTELAADFAAAIRGVPKEDLLSQEVRQQRRALTLAWSAVTVLLILSAAAAGAGFLAYRAQQQAVQNFGIARRTADGLVVDIARGLRNVLGMPSDSVRKILDTAKATFEQLAASAPEDRTLQRSQALMLEEFGNTYQILGDLDVALRSHRDSLAIRERLVATDRSNGDWQRELLASHINVGDVLMSRGELGAALKSFRDGHAIAERFSMADSGNLRWQGDLGWSYERIGDVLVAQGKLDEALSAYRDSRTIKERMAESDRSNTRWQSNLAWSHDRVARVLETQGKLDDALQTYRVGRVIRERLVDTDRNNAQWQRELAVSHNEIGDVLARQGKLDDALAAFRESLALSQRLANVDRNNTMWQRDLSVAYEKVGSILARQSKFDEALAAYREGLAIRERLVAADRSNAVWQRDLQVSHDNVGDVLFAQGKFEEALKSYRVSHAIAERLAATDRNNTEWQRDLAVSYNKLGDLLWRQGKLEEALEGYRSSLAIIERLAALDRSNIQWRNDLQFGIGRIGSIPWGFILAKKFMQALEAADQAIALAPEKTWLSTNRAYALMFLDRVDEARLLYLKYRGQANVYDGKTWDAVVLDGFAALRKAGLTHPLMDEIESRFAAGG